MCWFAFIFCRFMPPDDPLGRHGPSLSNFLRLKPLPVEQKRQFCPYGENLFCGDLNKQECSVICFHSALGTVESWCFDRLHLDLPQTKSALMASNVSSTILRGQTNPICHWLMNWERKPRFLLRQRKDLQDYPPDSLNSITTLLRKTVPTLKTNSSLESGRVPHFQVWLVKINCFIGRILRNIQTIVGLLPRGASVRESGLGNTWLRITTTLTCHTSVWILASTLLTATVQMFHILTAAPIKTEPIVKTPFQDPSIRLLF